MKSETACTKRLFPHMLHSHYYSENWFRLKSLYNIITVSTWTGKKTSCCLYSVSWCRHTCFRHFHILSHTTAYQSQLTRNPTFRLLTPSNKHGRRLNCHSNFWNFMKRSRLSKPIIFFPFFNLRSQLRRDTARLLSYSAEV